VAIFEEPAGTKSENMHIDKRVRCCGESAMPIRDFIGGRSFDPETIDIISRAFLGVCEDLGLNDRTDAACEVVAQRVMDMMDGQRDPQAIRAAVLASFKMPR
jgi:hypothetical protein